MRCLLCCSVVSIVSIVALAACTPTVDEAKPADVAKAAPEPESEPESESKPESAPESEPESSPTPGEDAAPPSGPANPAGMHRVVEGEDLHLHPMADGGLVISVGPQLYIVGKGGTLTQDPALLAGLPAPFDPEDDGTAMRWFWRVDVTGRWPDAAFLSYWVAPAPRVDAPPRVTFRWRQDRWVLADSGARFDEGGVSWFYERGRSWIDGSVLSLRRHQIGYGDAAFISEWESAAPARQRRHERQTKAAQRKIAKAKQLVVSRGLPKGPDLHALMTGAPPPLRTFDSLPTGEIFAVTAQEQPQLLTVIEDRVREHRVPVPPGADQVELRDVFAASPAHVLVVGGYRDTDFVPLFAQWDGTSLHTGEPPDCAQDHVLRNVVELPDGMQVALCAIYYEELPAEPTETFWRPRGGAWTRADLQAREIAVFEGALWLAAKDGVYTTATTTPASVKAPTIESLDAKLLAEGPEPLSLQRRLY